MVDVHTKKQRSYNMSMIKSRDSKPELLVRSLIHRMGYRYSLHRKDLPSKPDIVLTRHKKIILVHGCFWHMHDCRYGRTKPATRPQFWAKKRQENRERDERNINKLKEQGWTVLIIWECQTKNVSVLTKRLVAFLDPTASANCPLVP